MKHNNMKYSVSLLCLTSLVNFAIAEIKGITAFGLDSGLSRQLPPSRPEQIWDNPMLKPTFENSTSTNAVVLAGQVAYLHCRVQHLGNRVVTWIRGRDSHVLTVGLFSYTTDQRFTALHSEGSSDWFLKISSSQPRDTDVYECQVPTEPKISRSFKLTIVEAKGVIEGPKDVHVGGGNTVNLSCYTSIPGEHPAYFYWYHNRKVLHFSDGKNILPNQDKKVISNLVITDVSERDSGNYTCEPENASPATVTIYVHRGEHPAAMHHGESSKPLLTSSYLLLLTICKVILISQR